MAVNIANKAIKLRYLAIITSLWLESSESTTALSEELIYTQVETSLQGDPRPMTLHVFNDSAVTETTHDLHGDRSHLPSLLTYPKMFSTLSSSSHAKICGPGNHRPNTPGLNILGTQHETLGPEKSRVRETLKKSSFGEFPGGLSG